MTINQTSSEYAGDVTPGEAWAMLQSDPNARLVDVRTAPEWNFVGVPDLAAVGQKPALVEWQVFPAMQVNPDFVALAARACPDKSAPVLLLCRSGARSRSAAIAMTRAGYAKAFNVAGGFEGDLDSNSHRGRKNGWKASGLPWNQT